MLGSDGARADTSSGPNLFEIVRGKGSFGVVARLSWAGCRRRLGHSLRGHLRGLWLLDQLVAELPQHCRGALVVRVDRQRFLEGAGGPLSVEAVDEKLGNGDHLVGGVERLLRLEQDVAQCLVEGHRLGRHLEANLQALDGLREEAGLPEGSGVGQDARDLRPGARRRRRLRDLFDDLHARLHNHVAVVPVGRGRAGELDGLLLFFNLAVADVLPVDVLIGRAAGRAGRGLGLLRRRRSGRSARSYRGRCEPAYSLVVRRKLEQLSQKVLEEILLARVARDARHLLLDLDRLRRLADDVESSREEAQRLEVALVRLEADLKLRERQHSVVRAAPGEHQLGRDSRMNRVGFVVQ